MYWSKYHKINVYSTKVYIQMYEHFYMYDICMCVCMFVHVRGPGVDRPDIHAPLSNAIDVQLSIPCSRPGPRLTTDTNWLKNWYLLLEFWLRDKDIGWSLIGMSAVDSSWQGWQENNQSFWNCCDSPRTPLSSWYMSDMRCLQMENSASCKRDQETWSCSHGRTWWMCRHGSTTKASFWLSTKLKKIQ